MRSQRPDSRNPARWTFMIALVAGLSCAVLASGGLRPSPATAAADSEPVSLRWQHTLLVQLAVADLDRAIAFYRDTLGFELESRDDDLEWARVKPGIANVTIGLGVQPTVKGSGSISLNFAVADVDAARRILESRGVEFLGDTIVVPGVVVLADFLDPDGNKIRLAGHPGGS